MTSYFNVLFSCLLVYFNVIYSVNCAVLSKGRLYRLDIVHYNDFHDRFEETTVSYPVCSTNDDKCIGGFARLYYEIRSLLKGSHNSLLLNAGDTFQGTYWYTLMKWNITQKFINLLPNDAHTIGNHEFDDGIPGIAPYLAGLQAPVVVANIDTSAVPALDGLYKPHVILEKQGRKIGIIGLITPDTKTSSNPGDVKFLEPIAVVKREADFLTKKGIDIIIVLSHCGLEVDKKMAKEVGENIDLIIGGHSHSLLWNGEAPSNEYVSGPYPVTVESTSNAKHKVLIVTASAFSKYLGNLTVFFDDIGDLTDFSATPVYLNRSIPEGDKTRRTLAFEIAASTFKSHGSLRLVYPVITPTSVPSNRNTVVFLHYYFVADIDTIDIKKKIFKEMKALLKPYADKLHSVVNEVIGYSSIELLAPPCGLGECAIGNFVADAFEDAAQESNVSDLTHVTFILRNMIRGSLAEGDITRGAIINVMPFTNKVVTFALPGRYLIGVFKTCMNNYWVAKPFNGPWMPHVAGLRLTINLTQGVDIDIKVKEGNKFEDLDLDKEYQVTTLGFLVRSGNEFEVLKRHGRNFAVIGKDTEVLENYIKKSSPLKPILEKRLTVIN